MQGAYRPIPSDISAPRMKLTPTPIPSFTPRTPSASPPPGNMLICVMNISTAAPSSAAPIPTCTFCRDHDATTPAPSQAPSTAAAISANSVSTSTFTIVV